jgi:hypothetical protein
MKNESAITENELPGTKCKNTTPDLIIELIYKGNYMQEMLRK